MRVLIITSEAPPTVSGISRCVGRLADGLRRRGHAVDTLSSADVPRLVLGEVRLSSFAGHWRGVSQRLAGYDVVNLHGPVPTLSDAYFLLSRFSGPGRRIPVVYTHHSAIEIDRWPKACDVYNGLHRWLSRNADRTITTSTFYRDLLFGPRSGAIDVVPWGVDAAVTPPERRLRGASDPLKVLFVGQMRPYKGVGVLLDAVIGRDDIALTLVGTGAELPLYQQIAARRGAENVAFLGRVSDEELAQLYAAHDVICLPSVTRAEAFGLVVLEGMAAGLVPVVAELPGVRDLAQDVGVVVPPRDVRALRRALIGLARDRERLAELRTLALHRASELSWERCVAAYENAMVEVVAQRSTTALTAVPAQLTAASQQLEAVPVAAVTAPPRLQVVDAPAPRRASA